MSDKEKQKLKFRILTILIGCFLPLVSYNSLASNYGNYDNGFTDIDYGKTSTDENYSAGTNAIIGEKQQGTVAIGNNAYAIDKSNSGGATVIGAAAYVDHMDSIAIGDVAINTGTGSIVIGSGGAGRGKGSGKSVVTADGAIGMGYLVAVTGQRSIALGAYSKTTGTNTHVEENNVVGIGNRRMTQMADGTADTDGVTVKQLNTVKNSTKVYTGSSDIL